MYVMSDVVGRRRSMYRLLLVSLEVLPKNEYFAHFAAMVSHDKVVPTQSS